MIGSVSVARGGVARFFLVAIKKFCPVFADRILPSGTTKLSKIIRGAFCVLLYNFGEGIVHETHFLPLASSRPHSAPLF